jgi:hypothetical protein
VCFSRFPGPFEKVGGGGGGGYHACTIYIYKLGTSVHLPSVHFIQSYRDEGKKQAYYVKNYY